MACYKPISGYLVTDEKGNRKFKADKDYSRASNKYMEVPCGRCIGCRLERSREWAVRLVHEARCYPEEQCHFLTLTYAQEPEHGTLVKKHFQDFMKRLRKKNKGKIRFFHCGEYGQVCLNCGKSNPIHHPNHKNHNGCASWSPTIGRPHYHAIIYGLEIDDLEIHRVNHLGDIIYKSQKIEDTWTHGFITVGKVTFESCAYVARYITKKINGKQAEGHYMKPLEVNPETGEITKSVQIQPEYITMSRRPGIGHEHHERYHSDVYPYDRVVIRREAGSYLSKPPRYYDKLLEKRDPEMYKKVKLNRERAINPNENTDIRLDAREMVKRAQTKNLTRNFEEHHNDY